MAEKIDFDKLNFEKFRELALNDDLSSHEKVGFPNSYREDKEPLIFADMVKKLTSLEGQGKTILEIGPGCSRLPAMLADLCQERQHEVLFVDSTEMLALLPDGPHIKKIPGRYPQVPSLFESYTGKVDVIIAYSVIQYVFAEGNLWDFMDQSMNLLRDGGEIFFGDVPNITMRKRFFSSAAGIACHQAYTGTDQLPTVVFNQLEPGQMDDTVVLSMLARARSQGFHAWVLPQSLDLPMGNRREDILIRKP